jgi:hypothetical protein
MGRDWFAILGLAPGRHDSAEIARRFMAERARLLAALHRPGSYEDARRRLDELHWAYAAVSNPRNQVRCSSPPRPEDDPAAFISRMIAAALEDGLLRYSRRKEIVATALRLGLSEFHAQLLIAQVQFGDDRIPAPTLRLVGQARPRVSKTWAGVAAVGVLAVALFLTMVRWLGV